MSREQCICRAQRLSREHCEAGEAAPAGTCGLQLLPPVNQPPPRSELLERQKESRDVERLRLPREPCEPRSMEFKFSRELLRRFERDSRPGPPRERREREPFEGRPEKPELVDSCDTDFEMAAGEKAGMVRWAGAVVAGGLEIST